MTEFHNSSSLNVHLNSDTPIEVRAQSFTAETSCVQEAYNVLKLKMGSCDVTLFFPNQGTATRFAEAILEVTQRAESESECTIVVRER
jgi:hypothetical protein